MKRKIAEIREEMQRRGITPLDMKDVALWGILFAIEDLKKILNLK